ncbi:MAG: hypothetical protein WC250_04100 [Candidatus Paceibacterota bacterium]
MKKALAEIVWQGNETYHGHRNSDTDDGQNEEKGFSFRSPHKNPLCRDGI